MRSPNIRHSKMIGLLLAAGMLLGPAARADETADTEIQNANRKVLEEIRSGNRDTQKLMKILSPAIKARTAALEQKAKMQYEEDRRLARERQKDKARSKLSANQKGSKDDKGAKNVRPTNPVNSLNGASRYGGSGHDDAPIMDPASVPKEVTFEKGASAETTETATDTSGVDEIQFEAQPKAEGPAVKPAVKPTPRR